MAIHGKGIEYGPTYIQIQLGAPLPPAPSPLPPEG